MSVKGNFEAMFNYELGAGVCTVIWLIGVMEREGLNAFVRIRMYGIRGCTGWGDSHSQAAARSCHTDRRE